MALWTKRRGAAAEPPATNESAASEPGPAHPPVPIDTGTTAAPENTVAQHDSTVHGWQSGRPIVIGMPTVDFEPRAVESQFRHNPYRPDTLIDGWSDGPFTLRAASVRGYLHRYNGIPRQDDFVAVVSAAGDRLMVAVADGVSAATRSHLGSSAAVRYATRWLAEQHDRPLGEIEWKALFESAAWALIEYGSTVLELAEPDARLAEGALATTLTCAVFESASDGALTATIAGVGDSGAWLLSNGCFTPVWGGKQADESGMTSSAVSGLPRVPDQIAPVIVTVAPGEVLLVGTDGFGDPLGDGDGDVGALFTAVLGGTAPPQLEFAHALDFSRSTFDDDRTLVAVWPAAESTEEDHGAPTETA